MKIRGNPALPSTCEVSGNGESLGEVLGLIEQAERPAPPGLIEEWLAELSVSVAARAEDEVTLNLRVEVYRNFLASYPADAIYEAVCVKRWRFWPSKDELGRELDRLLAPRRVMRACVERSKRAFDLPKPEPEPEAPKLTEEQRKELAFTMEGIKLRAGFTPERRKLLNRHRMASTDAEMEATEATRAKLTYQNPDEGDPTLIAARRCNPIMRAAMEGVSVEEARRRIAAEQTNSQNGAVR